MQQTGNPPKKITGLLGMVALRCHCVTCKVRLLCEGKPSKVHWIQSEAGTSPKATSG